MTSRTWLPLALLLAATTNGQAQPYGYGYGPGPVPGYTAPWPTPYRMPPAGPWMPSCPTPAQQQPAAPAPAAPPQAMQTPAPAPTPAPATQPQDTDPTSQAAATLKTGMDKLLQFLAQDELPNQLQVAAFLDREIAPYFDFAYMTRWVAGPAYAGMTADQRQALAAQIESDFLGAMATHLVGYQGQQIRMLAPRVDPRGAVTINVAIVRPGEYPTTLQFRMFASDGNWRVYDVVADGQSAALYYRTQFQRMAAQERLAGQQR